MLECLADYPQFLVQRNMYFCIYAIDFSSLFMVVHTGFGMMVVGETSRAFAHGFHSRMP